MPPEFLPESIPVLAGAFILLYLGLVALGRSLKRRAGLPLGLLYQLFCVTAALYLPLRFLGLRPTFDPFDLRRETGAACVLLGSFFVIALVRRFLFQGYFQRVRQMEVPKFLLDLGAVVILFAAVLFVLPTAYHVHVTGLLAGSGILTLVLGFAMQDLLGNILSGVALEISKPFKPGDWLLVEKEHAQVIEVNWRSTRLRTNDDIYFDIPNKQIVGQTITNLSYPTREHAVRLTVGIDYDASPNRVRAVLTRAAVKADRVLPAPPPRVFLKDFGDSAVVYEIKFWIANQQFYNEVMDCVRTNIWYELRRANISIPYPHQVHVNQRRSDHSELPKAVRHCVSRQELFQSLAPEQIETLIDSGKILCFGIGERLIEQGSEGSSMFVLVSGQAQVSVTHEEGEQPVAELHSGECFGEMSLLTGEPRTATVTATTDCEVLEIGKEVFGTLLAKQPELLNRLSELLAERRLETEGILASNAGAQVRESRQREYQANFFARLRSFFEL